MPVGTLCSPQAAGTIRLSPAKDCMLKIFPYPEIPIRVSPSLTLLLGDANPVNLAHEPCHVILAGMGKPCLGGMARQAEVHITQP